MFRNLPILIILCVFCQACAYGIYEDKRMLDTQTQDSALATEIKAALIKNNLSNAMDISVYSFYRNVFLVGEASPAMQAKALAIARSYKPKSVTPHWFQTGKGERSDFMLATDLRAALIGTRGLSSTRIDTQVNAGHVVLLGVVHDDQEKQLAINTARKIKGVISVTSYLMLPPRPIGQGE